MRRMSDDPKPAPATKPVKAEPKAPAAAVAVAKPAVSNAMPSLEERRLEYDELAPYGKQPDVAELGDMLRAGRAIVRANAALGLAAAGTPTIDLVTLLRDSEVSVALATAEAFAKLGMASRPLLPQIAAALDG